MFVAWDQVFSVTTGSQLGGVFSASVRLLCPISVTSSVVNHKQTRPHSLSYRIHLGELAVKASHSSQAVAFRTYPVLFPADLDLDAETSEGGVFTA